MAVAFVQFSDGAASTAAVVTAAFSQATTTGNTIIATFTWSTAVGTVTSVTDSQGNVYTPACPTIQAQGRTVGIYYSSNIIGGICTVTLTLSGSQTSVAVKPLEFSGLNGNLNGSNTNSNGAAVTNPTSGSITTTQDVVMLVGNYRGGAISAFGAGWTGFGSSLPEYRVTTVIGTYAATYTTGASTYAAVIASFKATVTPPTAPVVTTLSPPSVISDTSVVLMGLLNSDGGQPITANGFNWGLTSSYGNTVTTNIEQEDRQIELRLTGLSPNTTYHYRVFSVNSVGTGLGTDATFTTRSSPIDEVIFNGTQLGTTGSDTNSTTKANLIDANNFTIWSTSVLGTWAGIDCGIATTLTRLNLSPVPAFEDGAIGLVVQGSSDPTFATSTTLLTIRDRIETATLQNETFISCTGGPYRYYRVYSPTTWYLADIDFVGVNTASVAGMCATPIITPPGGNFDKTVRVRISSYTSSASIYYTTDGSTPTTSSTLYTGPFTVSANTVVKAIAHSASLTDSRIASYTFLIPSIMYGHQFRWDDRNTVMQAFQGFIFQDPVSGWWYNYIVNQDNPVRQSIASHSIWQGYNCYRSADLRNWTYRGNICGAPVGQMLGYTLIDLKGQMFYNSTTGLYVFWTGPDSLSYGIHVYTSPSPEGPFTLAATYAGPLADGLATSTYTDVGSFVDPTDGKAYLIYNCNNNAKTCFSQLDPANYTNTLGPGVNSASYAIIGEGHAMFKNGSTYFYMYSGLTGGNYNTNHYATSSSPIGPWTGNSNPCVAVTGMPNLNALAGGLAPDNTLAYQGQTDQFFSIPGRGTNFIWRGADGQPSQTTLKFSDCTFLAVVPTSSTTFTLTWLAGAWFDGTAYSPWQLDTVFPTVSGAPLAPSNVRMNTGILTWANNEPKPHALYVDRATDQAFTQNVIAEVVPMGTTSFTDAFFSPSFYYRVRAVNTSGTTTANTQTDSVYNNPSGIHSPVGLGEVVHTGTLSQQYQINK